MKRLPPLGGFLWAGASIALAQGFVYAGVEAPVVAALGDSTFFHAGIPALLNAAAQNVNLTVV